MKQEERLTDKKVVRECELKDDKRCRCGYRQIPHKIERNVIYGISTIHNDMDCHGDYVMDESVDRLADYEDTGLSPEEVEDLQAENARLTERLKNAVKLPCKVGESIWCISDDEAVGYIFLMANEDYVFVTAEPFGSLKRHINNSICEDELFGFRLFHRKDCFATRPEAEARLCELKSDKPKENENG